jgi:hypothetical protein
MSSTSHPTPDEAPGRGHSEDYFGDYRDFWWNGDFVALMAPRLGLSHCRRVLDAGCGIGHWTRVLVPHLAIGTAVAGVDTDAKWASGQSNVALDHLPEGITLALERGCIPRTTATSSGPPSATSRRGIARASTSRATRPSSCSPQAAATPVHSTCTGDGSSGGVRARSSSCARDASIAQAAS